MTFDFNALYAKYDGELRALAARLRPKYHAMQRAGYRTVFGDVEGEVLYMLLRETKPQRFFEISPAAGYSTNYILAALTANQSGELHSFELMNDIDGCPIEQVIRGNIIDGLDQKRLHLHIGDAQQTTKAITGDIDFCLIDSCHEDWFAKWYIENVFPRVKGLAFVQDIVFHDRMELTTEASYFWDWAGKRRLPFVKIGTIEHQVGQAGLRGGYPERRAMECNSIFFTLPQQGEADLPAFAISPDALIRQAEEHVGRNETNQADEALTHAVSLILQNPRRANRHRLFIKIAQQYARMNEREQVERCFQRALGVVMQAELAQRPKGLRELWRQSKRNKFWRLAAEIFFIRVIEWISNPRASRVQRGL